MQIKGTHGELRYGYLVAAQLGKWVSDGRTVRAPILTAHSLYIARRPLTLWIAFGRNGIVWSNTDVQIAGSRVVVTRLDPPEV